MNRPITSKQIELEIVFQNSLAVQWLRLGAFTAVGSGLIPGWETKIPPARQGSHKKKKKKKELRTESFLPTQLLNSPPLHTSLFPWEKIALGSEANV